MNFSIIKHRKYWLITSAVLVTISLLAVGTLGMKFGIDFTGGSLTEVVLEESVDHLEVSATLGSLGYPEVSVQETDETGLLIRTRSLEESEHQELLSTLREEYGELEEMRFDSIGPVIGQELRRDSSIAIVLTLVLIGLYIAYAFRKVSKPVTSWKYGLMTILTAFHDVIITVGAFSILGYFFGWEVGTTFVAAILTILGYSINDTVVVFDRTRENLQHHPGDAFEDTVDMSVKQTMSRSINTSVTTLLALTAIFLFGGESTQPFALALMIGIAIGTYSSLFLASPALVTWKKLQK